MGKLYNKFVAISLFIVVFLVGCTLDEVDEFLDIVESVASDDRNTNEKPVSKPDGEVEFIFFDVGQGDSSLILTPSGETILIDTGRHDDQRILQLLEREQIQQIDLLVLTHPHADHIGNAHKVIEAYPPKEIWMSGDEHTSKTFERVIDAALSTDAAYHEPRVGETYEIGGLVFEILNPETVNGELNNGSIAFNVIYGDVVTLYTGDAEKEAEQVMVDSGLLQKVDILKVGHHGSSTSSHSFFLEKIKPDIAIYSAETGNEYGHPHVEAVQRLTDIGASIYGTDEYGTIRVYTDGTDYEIVSER